MQKVTRPQLTDEHIFTAMRILAQNIDKRLEKHGRGAFASYHEAFGIIHEEYRELDDALHRNDYQNFAEECIDIAVATIVAVASMISGKEAIATEASIENIDGEVEEQTTYSRPVDVQEVFRIVHDLRNGVDVCCSGQ